MPKTAETTEPKTAKAKKVDALEVLALYARNMDEIRRWFRNSTTPGLQRGHIVLGEYYLALALEALTLALEGKAWEPGNRQP